MYVLCIILSECLIQRLGLVDVPEKNVLQDPFEHLRVMITLSVFDQNIKSSTLDISNILERGD